MILNDEPARTIGILKKYDLMPRKKFGQNFLIDGHVIEKIIDAAGVTEDDCVLEIGPGIGTMTRHLCARARKVIAIEIDRDLVKILKEDILKDCTNLTIINEDVLKVDIEELVRTENGGRPVKVVANLPYYITTPIIMGLFEKHVPMESMTLMVQKEVAQRMCAKPGTKDYGALTVAVSYYSECYLAANVPMNCFMPRPDVMSAVVRLTVLPQAPVTVKDRGKMFAIVKAAFGQRRKTLQNALMNAQGISCTKEDVANALESMGLSPLARGEVLSLEQFARISELL
ncbi:MAG: 16S rRNA (adenine(1518)-N(6)/adenine(1519)-N(6))-dimethyltransferase RsmA [Lachnospiraceae bacterium]|jgi:16S rRNA (adenine1518-N6/adenine1519-N6)-dimethyltransferase|nr:16S rRNA (adenine(1518)-N(6)/adenine(1519)-N(6))-dimethyltransferase RsmA [Lachnospiraceae bacterium]